MFGTWATASDADVAEALKFSRVVGDDPDYSKGDYEHFSAADSYEAAGHIPEQHEHHHTPVK